MFILLCILSHRKILVPVGDRIWKSTRISKFLCLLLLFFFFFFFEVYDRDSPDGEVMLLNIYFEHQNPSHDCFL